MAEPTRLLVTGSRTWSQPEVIRRVFTQDARRYGSVVLVHGQCDPRRPRTGKPVWWAAALRLAREDQMALYGADWLCALLAPEFGWQVEAHPAPWTDPCRASCKPGHRAMNAAGRDFCPAAGNYRNDLMVRLGARAARAFIDPCCRPRCRTPHPHDSHGSVDAVRRVKLAGIPVRIERSIQDQQLAMEVPSA